ncbi:response regulator [Desulfonema magnum]|uniref:Two component system response regulator n=1 Tax=Desulfonema magnum TaxID=45655 RepID=A0A975BXX0_9BACT|nr:response regulator [Desulfonema magnum]QTA93189.1 Two component system response regulator [Desulfonema magnum]
MSEKEILVVDDDIIIRHMFEEAFEKAGYHIQSAESAETALTILKEKHFRVMFLDLKLPGMSGIELCRQIKKDKPYTIIYAITAYASIFELSDCLDAGFDDYFTKPVKLEILLKAAQNAFAKTDQWKQKTE